MTRRPALPPRPGVPIRPDEIRAGFYLTRLVRGGPEVPLEIWHGAPLDPTTGEELDRSPRWCMVLDGSIGPRPGELCDEDEIHRTFIWAVKRPISAAEYRFKSALASHAREHEPAMAEASPREKTDYMRSPTPW